MSPTPNLQDLIQSVRNETVGGDPLVQLAKAAEYAADLSGLGDQLLDHFVFQGRQAGMSWSELSTVLGVSKQAVHKRFTGTMPNFHRFTDKARSVSQETIELARSLGHSNVATEHLLVALFEPADSLAALTLAGLGLQREAVLERLLEHRPRTDEAITGAIPFTANAKGVLRGAVDESIDLNHNYIGTEHILLGTYREPDYTSARILTELGVQKEALRSTLLEILERFMRERAALKAQTQ